MNALEIREKKTAERIEAYERKIGAIPKVFRVNHYTELEKFEERNKERCMRLRMRKVGASFKKENFTCVYALLDPGDKELFYVGVTTQSHKRKSAHKQASSKVNPRLHEKLQDIKAKGCTPLFVVLERVENKERWQKEKQWIEFFTELGMSLLNIPYGEKRKGKKKPYRRKPYIPS